MMRSIESGLSPEDATAARQAVVASIPVGRYVEPEEVARAMLFLVSDDASFCTGSAYMVDGGITAQ
ncbi:4-formylbenzenesulfonate dehydrogenase TsaC1/TsaC2 [compost metagenome]